MSTALTTEKEFQEKIMERIRSAVGELIPNDALANICDEGIRKAFFDPIIENEPYGYGKTRKDPWFIQFVRTELQKVVNEAVADWLNEHKDEIRSKVNEYIDVGMVSALVNGVNRLFAEPFRDFGQRIEERLFKLENGQ